MKEIEVELTNQFQELYLKYNLDNTHPMAYGYNDNYYFSLKIGNSCL